MKSNILILFTFALAFTLSACTGDKNQRVAIKKRELARTASQSQEKMKFAQDKGCLSLTAVMDFYKADSLRAGRITVRDVSTESEVNDKDVLPVLLKERPLEFAIDQAVNLGEYFPLKIVKQNDCDSVEVLDANGKPQTLRIEKNRVIKRQPEVEEDFVQKNRRPPPSPKAKKRLPPSTAKAALSEYSPELLLLTGDNGEKWSYRFDAQTKSLVVTSYKTVESIKGCPRIKNLRIKEIYDIALVTDKADGVRVSANVLNALSTLGIMAADKTQKTATKKSSRETVKSSRMLTSDQYAFIVNQLTSDKVKAPPCD